MEFLISLIICAGACLAMGWVMLRLTQPPSSATDSGESLLRRVIHFCLDCLNWKVLAGIVVIGLAVGLLLPGLALITIPLLLLLACPLMMIVMMRRKKVDC